MGYALSLSLLFVFLSLPLAPSITQACKFCYYYCMFQVTRHYAEFSAALVSINQSHPDDQVDQCLSSLQGEVENFILRMAMEFPQRREQLIFLINNYDMMLSVLMVTELFFESF